MLATAHVPNTTRVLSGLPMSPGLARGPVLVITAIEQLAAVAPGDIVVLRNADPAHSAALTRAAAVVTETGGALTALATLAREYRIPALAAVTDATTLLRDRETVEIDGNLGTLTRLSR